MRGLSGHYVGSPSAGWQRQSGFRFRLLPLTVAVTIKRNGSYNKCIVSPRLKDNFCKEE